MNARRLVAVLFIISMLFLYVLYQYNNASKFPTLKGPYLGQTLPGDSAQVFAPNIVSTGFYNRDLAMTPDGKEIYFGVVLGNHDLATIMQTKEIKGKWTEPEVASFATHPDYKYMEPAISPDGKRFYFVSNIPKKGGDDNLDDYDIWVMQKTETGWGEPENLGAPVNTEGPEFFPSITREGTLYFTRDNLSDRTSAIFRSRLVDGNYQPPKKLGPVVNGAVSQFNAYVAPDESFLIVPMYGRDDSFGATDYYICFRDADDTWTGPFHLDASINSKSGQEYSPYVSPDGKFFFFMAPRPVKTLKEKRGALYPMTREKLNRHFLSPDNGNPNICWISTDFIKNIKKNQFP